MMNLLIAIVGMVGVGVTTWFMVDTKKYTDEQEEFEEHVESALKMLNK